MSFTFIYDINNKTSTDNGLTKNQNFSYRVAGDIFNENISIGDIYSQISSGKKIDLEGEFSILFNSDEEVFLLNDELGCIKWFYFLDNEKLIVSNDFWSIVKEARITTSDINNEALYEILLLGLPLENKTWIHGINVFPRGSLFRFDKVTSKVLIEEMYTIEYTESLDDENIAHQKIDNALQKTVDNIVRLNSEKSFLFSTSGGLDSRFPLLYSKAFPNKESFLIGKQVGLGTAYDYQNAKHLTKYYSLNLDLVDPLSQPMEQKARIDIIRNPLGHSNVLKALDVRSFIKDPENTVLVTGAHGGLIGGRKINESLLNSSSDEELGKNMFVTYSLIKELNHFKRKKGQQSWLNIKKVILLLKGGVPSKLQSSASEEVEIFLKESHLIPEEYRKKMLHKFIIYFKVNKGSTLTKIMRYHLLRHSIRGMFESMLGQVKSYTIYTYYIYSISKEWSIKFLYDRYIMQSFLEARDTFSSKIALQTYKPSVGVRSNRFSTLRRLMSLKLRKLVINYKSWWQNKATQKFVKKTLEQESTFYKIFPKDEVYEYLFYTKDFSQTKETLVKLKLLVDYLEELQGKNHEDRYTIDGKY